MSGKRLITLLTLVFVTVGSPGHGQERPTMLPDLQRIADRGTLRVAVLNRDLPPMIEIDEDGRPKGFDIRLVEEIARILEVEPEFIMTADTQGDLLEIVARRDADIGVSHLGQSAGAARFVNFTRPYLIEDVTFLINRAKGLEYARHCPGRKDLERLLKTPDQVGVLDFSFYHRFLRQLLPAEKSKSFDDFNEMMTAVQAGDVLGTLQGEVAAKYFLSVTPQAAIKLKICTIGRQKDRVSIAVRPDAPDLLRWLNLFISNREVVVDADSVIYQKDATTF